MPEENYSQKLLYCDFCGKSQNEVRKLIQGGKEGDEHRSCVCDECTQLCAEIVIEESDDDYVKSFISGIGGDWKKFLTPEGMDAIVREIEFPPEYRHAGITILANFSSIIREKYRDQAVKVSIQQEENKVILIVQGKEGIRERIEETLETYGLVLSGEEPVEKLTTDPYKIAELNQQLRIAHLQLENQRELLQIEKRHNEQIMLKHDSIEAQYKHMIAFLSESLTKKDDEAIFSRKMMEAYSDTQSKLAKDAIGVLIAMLNSNPIVLDEKKVEANIKVISENDPGALIKLRDFAESCAAGVVGNSVYAWIIHIINSLPK